MKPGGEGVLADDVNMVLEEPTAAATAVAEGESDNEYEKIPARKEKQRRVEAPERQPARQPPREPEAPHDADAPSADTATELDDHKMPDVDRTEPEATDDDWLRSRTNRLLDLVDPDELPLGAPTTDLKNGSAPGGVDKNELSEPVDDKPAREAAFQEEVDDETETVEGGNTADAIRRTSRLFVRNLPYSATEDDIREAFARFGTLEEVRQEIHDPLLTQCGRAT